ncbi:hypothetical protein PDL71_15255 [Lacibacter sp. MH-610]|uniref:hypothetical protein n=1 Tax=Lacibacter sp. MH-610 TaxID=3020883 RepID=UPI0038921CAD
MSYSYWKAIQDDPSLAIEPVPSSKRKQHVPVWIQKLRWEQEFRKEIGEERYQQFLKQDEERERRYQQYMDNE